MHVSIDEFHVNLLVCVDHFYIQALRKLRIKHMLLIFLESFHKAQ